MVIERFESDLLASNMYVVSEHGHAIVIDPYINTAPANGLIVDKILLTHEHYDHISGVLAWQRMTGAPVVCSKICFEHVQNPKKNLSNHFKDFCELQTWVELDQIPDTDPEYTCHADEFFEDEYQFEWFGHQWRLFEMPGHSLGSIGIVVDDEVFFSGDSLMEEYDIELRLPGGSKTKWRQIGKPRLDEIPEGIHVYPGHFKDFWYTKTKQHLCINK